MTSSKLIIRHLSPVSALIAVKSARTSYPLVPITFSRFYAATNAATRTPIQIDIKADPPLPQTQQPPSQIVFKTAGQPSRDITDGFNPPESTRPAPLDLPIRAKCPSVFKYYFRLGRAYLSFYKTGLQNIRANRKLAKSITQRITAQRAEYKAQVRSNPEKPLPEVKVPWTRAEFQVIRRSQHDVSRVPLFLVMLAVCGEFLPLIMAVFKSRITPLLPYTVWLPSQTKSYHEKMITRREQVQAKYEGVDFEKRDLWQYLNFGMEYFSLQPKLLPSFVLPILPNFIKLRATMFYYEYLFWDDKLLGEHGIKSLVDDEVVIATIERGIWDPKASIEDLRKRLLASASKTLRAKPDEDMALRRKPSVK